MSIINITITFTFTTTTGCRGQHARAFRVDGERGRDRAAVERVAIGSGAGTEGGEVQRRGERREHADLDRGVGGNVGSDQQWRGQCETEIGPAGEGQQQWQLKSFQQSFQQPQPQSQQQSQQQSLQQPQQQPQQQSLQQPRQHGQRQRGGRGQSLE